MISMWRWYRWVPVLLGVAIAALAAWWASVGQWGRVPVDVTLIGINVTNAAFCHYQYKLAGVAGRTRHRRPGNG